MKTKLLKGEQYYIKADLNNDNTEININIYDYVHKIKVAEGTAFMSQGRYPTIKEILANIGKNRVSDIVYEKPIVDVTNNSDERSMLSDIEKGIHEPIEIMAIYNQDGQFDPMNNQVIYVDYKLYSTNRMNQKLESSGTLYFDNTNSNKSIFEKDIGYIKYYAMEYLKINKDFINKKYDVNQVGEILKDSVLHFAYVDDNEYRIENNTNIKQNNLDQLWADINKYDLHDKISAPYQIEDINKKTPIIINRACVTKFNDMSLIYPRENVQQVRRNKYTDRMNEDIRQRRMNRRNLPEKEKDILR